MDPKIQLLGILGTGALLLIVLELVRRRRLAERYALLWLVSALVLLVLAAWRGALTAVASLIGIASPPNALFFLAFATILIVLLHFSVVISRLSDQTKVLAQRVAMLDQRLRRQEEDEEDAGLAEPPELSQRVGSRFSSSP